MTALGMAHHSLFRHLSLVHGTSLHCPFSLSQSFTTAVGILAWAEYCWVSIKQKYILLKKRGLRTTCLANHQWQLSSRQGKWGCTLRRKCLKNSSMKGCFIAFSVCFRFSFAAQNTHALAISSSCQTTVKLPSLAAEMSQWAEEILSLHCYHLLNKHTQCGQFKLSRGSRILNATEGGLILSGVI